MRSSDNDGARQGRHAEVQGPLALPREGEQANGINEVANPQPVTSPVESEGQLPEVATPFRRVLVCGGRNFNDHSRLYHALDDIQDERGEFSCVITGDANGADHWAESWAWMEKVSHLKFAADWTGYGRAAGPIRNQIMIDEGKPDLVVAFPGGRGTADMVRRARAAGIDVIEVPSLSGSLG